jgi:hypothetical protein
MRAPGAGWCFGRRGHERRRATQNCVWPNPKTHLGGPRLLAGAGGPHSHRTRSACLSAGDGVCGRGCAPLCAHPHGLLPATVVVAGVVIPVASHALPRLTPPPPLPIPWAGLGLHAPRHCPVRHWGLPGPGGHWVQPAAVQLADPGPGAQLGGQGLQLRSHAGEGPYPVPASGVQHHPDRPVLLHGGWAPCKGYRNQGVLLARRAGWGYGSAPERHVDRA